MSCTGTYASLRIFSKDVAPSEATFLLKMLPTSQYQRDTTAKYKPQRENNFWSWSTKGRVDSNSTSTHIQEILNVLQDKQEVVFALKDKGCQIDIFCLWEFDGQGVLSLPISLMEQLVKIGLEINWDIYYDEGTDV